MKIPIAAQSAAQLWVQIPWEAAVSVNTTLNVDDGSPFQAVAGTVHVTDIHPQAVSPYFHQDFSSAVTADSPAHPGEVVHMYATGLGPVQAFVPTGAPGPANPPALVVTPVSCNFPVVFAGLAPGLIGFYEVSIQIPATAVGTRTLNCVGLTELPVKP